MMRRLRLKLALITFLLCQMQSTMVLAGEQITIEFNIPSSATIEMSRMYRLILDKFETKYPSIKVNFQPSSSYDDAVKNIIRTANKNKSFGVAVIEVSELFTLKDADAIIPYNKVLNEKEITQLTGLIIPKFLANCYGDDGKLYGIPLMRSTPIVYYNMSHLKKVGISEADLPKNWDDLVILLQKLKKEFKRPPFILANEWYDWLFEAFVQQNGGTLSNKHNTQVYFDHPKTIETLTFWKSLFDEGLMARVYGSWKANLNGFLAGMHSVIYYSTGGMGSLAEMEDNQTLSFEWMVDVMPKNKVYSAPVGAANLFLSKHMTQDETQASIKLVKFLLQPENQAQMSKKSGYFPVVKQAFNEPLLKDLYARKQFRKANKQLDFSAPKIMTKNNAKIRKLLKNAIMRTLEEDIAPSISLKEAQIEANKLLE